MLTLLTCRDYSVLSALPHDADAPAECRAAELKLADEYAVVASRDGVLVADADGWWPSEGTQPDAATATGMYDAW